MKDRVYEKLAKLLELASRGDENEAAVAAERAAELMAKHQISGLDVESWRKTGFTPEVEPETNRIDDERGAPWSKKFEAWQGGLAEAIAVGLGGRAFRAGNKLFQLWIIGPPGIPEAARYMYMALNREIRLMGRRAMTERGESNSWRRAYCMGVVSRIASRMKLKRESVMHDVGTALVLVRDMDMRIKQEMDNLHIRNSRTGGSKRPDGMIVGWHDGGKMNLGDNTQLEAGRRELK